MVTLRRSGFQRILTASLFLAVLFAAPGIASAQEKPGGLFSIGGYFPTAGSGRDALGDSKFFYEFALFSHPKQMGPMTIAYGLHIMSASDNIFPFTGDNQLNFYGGAVGISTPRVAGKIRPILTLGLYAGQLKSDRMGFDVTDFTPSVGVGVEWPVTRNVTLTAGYRYSELIHGVDTSGFNVGVRLF
jgi:hypothetical protein